MRVREVDVCAVLASATKVLQCGGTLLYPTDTIWGIGCDGCNAEAVEQLYRIKRRDHTKPMLVLATAAMLSEQMPAPVRQLLLAEGRPTTAIVPLRWLGVDVAANLLAEDGSIGVRVPRHFFCRQLAERLGHPIVSSSANLSGHPSPRCYDDVEAAVLEAVDFCVPPVPAWESHERRGSKIVKVSPTGEIFTVRD
ncbi:MAG: putative Protein yrdC [bacterium P3]|nr:MAG: putative Protein yrdC [bacterium P3]KWW40984.1 MAG: putative Protein yrdC [bacterium F083]